MLSDQEYLELIPIVNKFRTQVHSENIESISESALDDLKHKITQYENTNPDKINSNSPNFVKILFLIPKLPNIFVSLRLTD